MAVTAYFLIASPFPDDDGSEPPICVEGLTSDRVALTLQSADTEVVASRSPSCRGYDGLDLGTVLTFELTEATDPESPDCHRFAAELETLPPGLGGAVISSSSSRPGAPFYQSLDLERPEEPGCRFRLSLTVQTPQTEEPSESERRALDVTAVPLIVDREIWFPQVHLCAGALEGQRGEQACSDSWAATLGFP